MALISASVPCPPPTRRPGSAPVGSLARAPCGRLRARADEFDGTRPVTQNDNYEPAAPYLDIMGFSHKSGAVFDAYHAAHPQQPMMATECCSCMSQRGVDEDACPKPEDGGCTGGIAAGLR